MVIIIMDIAALSLTHIHTHTHTHIYLSLFPLPLISITVSHPSPCSGLSAGVYATNAPEACHYVLNDCKANVCVVENQKQLDKILEVKRY